MQLPHLLGLLGLLSWFTTSLPFNAPLLDTYDYIVVGGGISGLVVANRLTEDPDISVLVLEAGPADNYEEIVMVPIFVGANIYTPWDWFFETTPQTYLDGNTRIIPQGRVVGGGSILNAMLWNRGGQGDYNDWAQLGNPGWDWNNMLPYFKRTETYTPVFSDAIAEQYDIHYDQAYHGFDGPVNVSFPRYFYNTSVNFFDGLEALGVPSVYEPNDGLHAGATYLPLDISPTNQSRADARRSYYDPYSERPNLSVSTNRYVTQLIYQGDGCANNHTGPIPGDDSTGTGSGQGEGTEDGGGLNGGGPPPLKRKRQTTTQRVIGVEHATDAESPRVTTLARREVIMAAGALQTPKILELSGIGDRSILQQNDISVVIDLPGVGNNLQDHQLLGTYYQFYNTSYIYSNQLNGNDTLNQQAREEYYANRTGPYTAGPADGNAFPSLPQISKRAAEIVAMARSQDASDHLAAGLDPTVVAGFAAQKSLITDALGDESRAVIEILNSNAGNLSPSNMRPFSRGTVHISSPRPFDAPSIDPRYGSNPIDTEVLYESLLFNRRLLETAPMAQLLPVQWAPPSDADEEDLRQYISNGIGTEYHPSGTCAMLPRNLGGVVDSDLLVYGTSNLRVVDASMQPTVPAAHLQAVVYAVAEKAADIIRSANTPPITPTVPNNSSSACSNTTAGAVVDQGPFSNATTGSPANESAADPSRDARVGGAPRAGGAVLLPSLSSEILGSATASSARRSGTSPQGPAATTVPAVQTQIAANVEASVQNAIDAVASMPPAPGPFAGYQPISAVPQYGRSVGGQATHVPSAYRDVVTTERIAGYGAAPTLPSYRPGRGGPRPSQPRPSQPERPSSPEQTSRPALAAPPQRPPPPEQPQRSGPTSIPKAPPSPGRPEPPSYQQGPGRPVPPSNPPGAQRPGPPSNSQAPQSPGNPSPPARGANVPRALTDYLRRLSNFLRGGLQ